MTGGIHLALAAGTKLEVVADGWVVHADGRRLRVKAQGSGLAAALSLLAQGGGLEQDLAQRVRQADGVAGLARLYYTIGQWLKQGLLVASARQGERTLATLVVLSPGFEPAPVADGARFLLSRFALLRRIDERLVLETPLGHAQVVLDDDATAVLVHALVRPASPADLQRTATHLEEAACAAVLTLLARARLVAPATADGQAACDGHTALHAWEFHDLLFHSRSRIGRHAAAVGASFRFAATRPSPPPFRAPHAGESTALPIPDLARAVAADPPFAAVQEGRRTFRRFGQPAISARQLGEFLYRAAAVRDTLSGSFDTPHGAIPGEFTVRPYPSGGSLYELELYPAIIDAADLPRGLHHYDARAHRLLRLATDERRVAALAAGAAARAGIPPDSIQVVLNVTARFERIAWKYESMAYALVLKHVGVLMETLYLVATALELAPCAIGSGDSDLFAAASGIDYYGEGLVGEFLLGTRPSD